MTFSGPNRAAGFENYFLSGLPKPRFVGGGRLVLLDKGATIFGAAPNAYYQKSADRHIHLEIALRSKEVSIGADHHQPEAEIQSTAHSKTR